MQDIELAIDILKALLTPTIAVVAVYIAYQQWKTNQQKLIWARYDRRLHVYEEVRRILSIITRDADVSYDELLEFRTSVSEADFLFGPEIMDYIDTLYKRGVKLHSWNRQYCDATQTPPPEYDHKKVADGMHAESVWLIGQFEPAKMLFKKYLDVSR